MGCKGIPRRLATPKGRTGLRFVPYQLVVVLVIESRRKDEDEDERASSDHFGDVVRSWIHLISLLLGWTMPYVAGEYLTARAETVRPSFHLWISPWPSAKIEHAAMSWASSRAGGDQSKKVTIQVVA